MSIPQWNDPAKTLELPFTKLHFVKSSRIWKLYRMRGSGKWESYQPKPERADLHELLTEIQNDAYSCFLDSGKRRTGTSVGSVLSIANAPRF
ncbi:DUF3024 domain-containing protein [Parapedobacter sp. ISTM3]|uniref:DUF3024 domain-containing protein n=1 Tax=Parapedobacter sp. ISTM3 TaxID=2800130 RepID=UPI001907FFFA|nr:DUF3024 domain-containing protein [Parapedobacter sp. ISTM3]